MSSGPILLGCIREAFEKRLQRRLAHPDRLGGLATGFRGIDGIYDGLQGGELTIVGARPSVGKTAFALSLLLNIGRKLHNEADPNEEYPRIAVFFSLEMSHTQVWERFVSMVSGVPIPTIRRGNLDDLQLEAIEIAQEELSELPIYVDDTAAITATDVQNRVRVLSQTNNIAAVFVDYLQIMGRDANSENNNIAVGKNATVLKNIAKQYDIPVVALAQLSRRVETREERIPILGDLRDSGQIEQDADNVIFLHRPTYWGDENEVLYDVCFLIVAKARSGPTQWIPVKWNSFSTVFSDLDEARVREALAFVKRGAVA